MKASTFIRLVAKYKLVAVTIDAEGNIRPDFGPAFLVLLLFFSSLAGYFLYLRHAYMDSGISFNGICLEMLALGFIMGSGFKVYVSWSLLKFEMNQNDHFNGTFDTRT